MTCMKIKHGYLNSFNPFLCISSSFWKAVYKLPFNVIHFSCMFLLFYSLSSLFRPLHCVCFWLAVSSADPKVIVCKVTRGSQRLWPVSQLWKCTLHDTNRLPLILSSARHVWHVSLFCLSSRLNSYLFMQPLSFLHFFLFQRWLTFQKPTRRRPCASMKAGP